MISKLEQDTQHDLLTFQELEDFRLSIHVMYRLLGDLILSE